MGFALLRPLRAVSNGDGYDFSDALGVAEQEIGASRVLEEEPEHVLGEPQPGGVRRVGATGELGVGGLHLMGAGPHGEAQHLVRGGAADRLEHAGQGLAVLLDRQGERARLQLGEARPVPVPGAKEGVVTAQRPAAGSRDRRSSCPSIDP